MSRHILSHIFHYGPLLYLLRHLGRRLYGPLRYLLR